ncbi:hypothetical protein PNOK_0082000 [Pyrrhoderma noxium]|uniref:TM7S3/TM198-like domain-containing protein n=1 Tax=Pyrrhoderma noxium TaxID=2282107 RepID=A0A286UW51_9AGAM|nr:hypothetical protein PNOK_0082000 [Pyrrhoderma noxium]
MSSSSAFLRSCLIFCLLSCTLTFVKAATFENGTSYILSNSSGTVVIYDPDTSTEIAQADASDGSGSGYDLPAILWIAMSFVLGVPLLLGGVRLGRITSGIGMGVGLSVAAWASIINTVSEGSISDIIIVILTLILFGVGFIVGILTIDYGVGSAVLGVAGGFSIGIRIVIMKEDLLVPVYYVDWLIATVLGVAALITIVCNERWGVLFGSSAVGSFFVGLGIDLLVNNQKGMSRGLRYMFDRNEHHLADLMGSGYTPLVFSQIIIGVSLAAIPLFAYGQHKLFPSPFWIRAGRPSSYYGDDASIRSKTWVGRFRGRRHSAVAVPDVEKNGFDSTQSLINSQQSPTTPKSKPLQS